MAKRRGKQQGPEAFCRRGADAMDAGEFEAALDSYEEALGVDPYCCEAHVGKVDALVALEDADRAVEALEEALERLPDEIALWQRKGVILTLAGRPAEAVACFDRALELEPGDAESWSYKGEALRAGGDFEAALACAERAVALDPAEPDLVRGLMDALLVLARWDDVAAQGERLRELGIDEGEVADALEHAARSKADGVTAAQVQADFWCTKADELNEAGDLDGALALLDRAAALWPGFDRPWTNRGSYLDDAGRSEEALACYDRALALSPANADALASRGNALKRLGRYDDALAAYDAALRSDPRHEGARTNQLYCRANARCPQEVRALVEEGQRLESLYPGEALSVFEQALARAPADGVALLGKASCLMLEGRHGDALPVFEAAAAASPDHPIVWSNRGMSLGELGRHDEAIASFSRAIELAPELAGPWSNRGEARRASGHGGLALADFDHALSLAPDFPPALFGKARALAGLGRTDEARAACRQLVASGGAEPEHLELIEELLGDEDGEDGEDGDERGRW